MPKFYHTDILDFGLDRPRERIAVGSKTLKLKVIKAYTAADSYATVNGNSVGESSALAAGDFTLANQGTNGRQVTVTGKTFTSTASTTQYDSGTATSGGATTLTDTGKAFTTNAHALRALKITGGTGAGQTRRIVSNTATVITVDTAWGTNPASGSTYQILDEIHVAVLNDTDSQVLLVTDETTDQVITSGNSVTVPNTVWKMNQPT